MSKIIAVANQKGGVGKTTTAVNLSSSLAVLDNSVLLIDADPQANTSHGLGFISKQVTNGTYELLQQTVNVSNCIKSVKETHPFDIIPTKINLALFETLPNTTINLFKLKNILDPIRHHYNFIIIDCSPNLGLLMLNVLCASDSIIVPVQCEYFAFEGLKKIFGTYKTIYNNYNSKLDIEGILLTMYNPNQKMDAHVKSQVEHYFEDLLFETIIYRNIKLSEAPSHGKSIYEYNNSSKGAINYLNLANEILLKNNRTLSDTNKKLGKSLSDILQEDSIDDIEFIVNLKQSKVQETKAPSFNNLVGLTKGHIKQRLGLTFNDMHSNVWMYRINDGFNLFKKNYLYIYFQNSKVVFSELKRFKQNEEKNRILLEKYTKKHI